MERTTHGANREVDAVEIVGIIRYKDKGPSILAIRQFRPPTGIFLKFKISF